MVNKEDIQNYIKNIPPMPKTLKECLGALELEDLNKASEIAKSDIPLTVYLKNIVNKPIFGFRKEITDIKQIFSILGILKARQLIKSYLVSLLTPKKWELFNLDNVLFGTFQADCINDWNKILSEKNMRDENISFIAMILPAIVAVCETMFRAAHREDLEVIKESSNVKYSDILKKLTDYSIVDIVLFIAKEWDFQQDCIDILESAFQKDTRATTVSPLAKYLHLLFFYEISRAEFIATGMSELIELDFEFVEDVVEDFNQIMGIN